jgi:hypothetical protein
MGSGGREGRRWWLLGRRGDVVTVVPVLGLKFVETLKRSSLKIYSKFVSNSESHDFI